MIAFLANYKSEGINIYLEDMISGTVYKKFK